MTKAEIDTAIKECDYKEGPVCKLNSVPCQRAMEEGQCDTLIILFKKESEDD